MIRLRLRYFLCLAVALLACGSFLHAQTCIGLGGPNPLNHPQNFDGLGNSPAPQNGDTANIFILNPAAPRRYLGKFENAVADDADIINVPGWAVVEEGTNVTAVTGRYAVGNGSVSGGNTFSFASVTLDGDRALGSLNDDTISINFLGGCFRNTSGSTITAVRIGFTGEMWRLGGSGAPDRLDFQYAVNAANLYSGSYTDLNVLDFVTPDLSGTAGARDGNTAPYRTIVPLLLVNVTLAPNDTLHVRWRDSNIAGADDGLAIDDFEIQINAPLAAEVAVQGRVRRASGEGLARARITAVGPDGIVRIVMTNPFGYYRITGLDAGQVYALTVSSKSARFSHPTRVVDLGEDAFGVDFVADP